MKVNVEVAPAIINWVMANAQMDGLSENIVKNLELWKNGDKLPTYNQIEQVSKATGIPLGYFFLSTPPVEDTSLMDCRTIDSISLTNPSRNLIDTIHDMEMIQDWMKDQLISESMDPLPFVGKQSLTTAVEDFANAIRKTLGTEIDWYNKNIGDAFKFFRTMISEAGVIVMTNGVVGVNNNRSLDIDEFRAFTIVDKYAPIIFINNNDSEGGKLFSLLHEFAHVCLGKNSFFNDRYSTGKKVKKIETVCNAVAAEILVPQSMFISEWKSKIKDSNAETTISELSKKFRCGITVIARKALDNGFIKSDIYQKTANLAVAKYNEQRKKDKDKKSGGNYYNTLSSRMDERFLDKLKTSVVEGQTLYSVAYRLTHTNHDTFDKLIGTKKGEK